MAVKPSVRAIPRNAIDLLTAVGLIVAVVAVGNEVTPESGWDAGAISAPELRVVGAGQARTVVLLVLACSTVLIAVTYVGFRHTGGGGRALMTPELTLITAHTHSVAI